MLNIIVWTSAAVVFVSAIIVVAAYFQSKDLFSAPGIRTRVNFFPDQFNLVYENIILRTIDGKTLHGWYVPSQEEECDKTIILMHGRASNKGELLANTHFLAKEFNLLYFDFRACGESSGDISTLGYLELKDFDAAFDFLKTHKEFEAKRIAVYGLSMGAAVAIYQTAKTPGIKCVAVEAAYDSYERVVGRWAWINRKVPYFPLIPLALFFAKMRLKISPEQFSPIYNVGKVSPKPIFFIHGSHDNLALPRYAKKLYRKAGEPKEWWLAPGAGHTECAPTGGKEYQEKLSGFFRANL